MKHKDNFLKKNITWITMGVILALALVIHLLTQCLVADSNQITILIDGQEQGNYSLLEEREVRIETEQGYNVLVIEDGQAYVLEADCHNQVCVNTRPVSASGGQIICLPHRVVIRLKKAEKSEIDAVTN